MSLLELIASDLQENEHKMDIIQKRISVLVQWRKEKSLEEIEHRSKKRQRKDDKLKADGDYEWRWNKNMVNFEMEYKKYHNSNKIAPRDDSEYKQGLNDIDHDASYIIFNMNATKHSRMSALRLSGFYDQTKRKKVRKMKLSTFEQNTNKYTKYTKYDEPIIDSSPSPSFKSLKEYDELESSMLDSPSISPSMPYQQIPSLNLNKSSSFELSLTCSISTEINNENVSAVTDF